MRLAATPAFNFAATAEIPGAEVVMKKLLVAGLVAALVPLSCRTGRTTTDMSDEMSRLEKAAGELEQEYDLISDERKGLEVELERMRDIYEEARVALARRDELRLQLEAQGYSPTTAEAYSTVAAGEEGQVRREPPVAESAGGDGGRPAPGPGGRALGRYTGPHTIHVVAKGEYLFRIASYGRYYGDGERWPVIYEANAYQIKDPHWIFAGQRLQIPIR
jgi:nucleoid-associated protein YgaU